MRPYRLVDKLVARDQRKGARRRAEAIAQQGIVGSAVERAIAPDINTFVLGAAGAAALDAQSDGE